MLEAARNVACAGGEPIGFTDCLNFGNPDKPEIGWELAEAIDGIAAACDAIGAPVVSGNVSLYNETNGRAIHPTPVVGAVGLVEDVRRVPEGWRDGDVVFAAFASPVSLAGSEYQARFGEVGGTPAAARPRGRGEARVVPVAGRPAGDARPRRLGRRARRLSRGGGSLLGLGCVTRRPRGSGGAVRRGRWPRGRRVHATAGRRRSRALRPSSAFRCAGSGRSAGVPCSGWSSRAFGARGKEAD